MGETIAFYQRYYSAIAASRAYAKFCQRVFGRNFGQHGFADMAQLDALLETVGIGRDAEVLDLGCGTGGMAAYMAEVTGARVTGIDISPAAIGQAQHLAAQQPGRLVFRAADMTCPPFSPASFDVLVAIDTLYFVDLDMALSALKALLRPGGRMGVYWSQGANPVVPIHAFPRETLPPDNTDLARALQRCDLSYRAHDFTVDDYRHARLKRAVLLDLRPQFEAEDTMFLFDNRMGEAEGVIAAVEAGAHARYLYRVRRPQ
jgi:cyclopropane fatty-acyl-phospholipid synthase-like methyltransferase